MATETVQVQLPEEVYQRLKEMATVSHQPLEDVLFQTIRGNLPPRLDDVPPDQRGSMADLQRFDDEALWAVAREPIPSRRWRRHQYLLSKGETNSLTDSERSELADLRGATDHHVISRSYALALLKWRGYTVPATA
jgi:hypothetical protein